MSRGLDLVFGFEDAAPKDVEELVDENEGPQEEEEQPKQRMKRPSAYIAVFEGIVNEIIDHEVELLSDEERQILKAFSQLPYKSKYTLTRLLQRNPGQWHPISTMEKFKKETGELGLYTSVHELCTLSVSQLLSPPVNVKPPEHEIIDLTLDSDDEDDVKPPISALSASPDTSFDPKSYFFCDNESKLELKDALNRLTAPDLHALAKDFKCNKSGKSNKDDVINALLNHARGQAVISLATATPDRKGKVKVSAKNGGACDTPKLKQTTLNGFLRPKPKSNQEQILLKRAVDKLGRCVRINTRFYNLVIRLHVIYYRSTELPQKPFTPSLLATFKKRFYPEYTHSRSVIWRTREDLLEYERALEIQERMSTAEVMDADMDAPKEGRVDSISTWTKKKKKDKDKEKEKDKTGETKAAVRSRAVLEIFQKEGVEALWDACCAAEVVRERMGGQGEGRRKPEMERFQCGHILTRLVSKASFACGPLKTYDEELRLLNKLLSQTFWRRGKKGEWYRRRAIIYMTHSKNLNPDKEAKKGISPLRKALEGIEEGLRDEHTHLVLRPDLFERYKKLEKRLKVPLEKQIQVARELREPVRVSCAGHRAYGTVQVTSTSAVTTTTTVTATSSGTSTVAAGSEKENVTVAGGGGGDASGSALGRTDVGVSINAELTSYYQKVSSAPDPDKEEAARLIAAADRGNGNGRASPKWIGKSKWRGEGGGEVTVEEFALQFYAKRGFNGFHSETRILTTLFALLFWDIIFSPIPGAFETRFQAGPLDLIEDSFYYARKDAIEQRIKEINNGEARKIVERHDELYRGRSVVCVGVRWDLCGREELCEVVECLKPGTLTTICRLFCEDYAARARGVPDLFVWDYGKRECKFVEVKGPGDRPSETQKLWFDTLLAAGANVEICSVVELTFRMVNSKKRKRKGALATVMATATCHYNDDVGTKDDVHVDGMEVEIKVEDEDSDEFQPDSDEGSMPPSGSAMRLRSATLTRDDDDCETYSGSEEGEESDEEEKGGVLSPSTLQPRAKSSSLGWAIPEEFGGDPEEMPVPMISKKKRRIV